METGGLFKKSASAVPTISTEESTAAPESEVAAGSTHSPVASQFDSAAHLAIRSEQNGRENNEDSFLTLALATGLDRPPMPVLALADGMGGHAFGEQVSRETLRKVGLALIESLTVEPAINTLSGPEQPGEEAVAEFLVSAIQQADAHVRRMVEANKWGRAGSTIVIAAIIENVAVVANLGDSPMFYYQARTRKLTQVTQDHTVAGALLRNGMITAEMARVHEGRSRLEFYVGSGTFPREAPVHTVPLSAGDLLLLCSDGVNGSLSLEQLQGVLDSDEELQSKADTLLQMAVAAGETDNQTLLLWRNPEGDTSPGTAAERGSVSSAPPNRAEQG